MSKKLYLHVGMGRQGTITQNNSRCLSKARAKHKQSLRTMLKKIAEQLNSSAVSGTPGEITEHPPASSQSPNLL